MCDSSDGKTLYTGPEGVLMEEECKPYGDIQAHDALTPNSTNR